MKKFLVIAVTLILACTFASPSLAANYDNYVETAEQYVAAVNQQNISEMITLFTSNQQDILTRVYTNPENIQNKIGYLNIKNTTLVDLQEISLESYAPFTSLEQYTSLYGDSLKAYLLSEDCSVYHENKYNYNGINYSILLLANENGEIKIVEDAAVPLALLDNLIKARSANDIQSLQQARNIAYARALGVITNAEGTILDINDGEHDIDESDYIGTHFSHYPITADLDYPHVRPETIDVLISNTGTIKTVDFNLYCKNVLPNEWYPTWPEESLKAGALCVKMVGWFRVEAPKYTGYDITDTTGDQKYIENSTTTATSSAYNEVINLSMHCTIAQGGYLFYAAYLSGTSGQIGEESSGTVLQHGTKKLDDDGYTYKNILRYYYDGSQRTYGNDIAFYYTT